MFKKIKEFINLKLQEKISAEVAKLGEIQNKIKEDLEKQIYASFNRENVVVYYADNSNLIEFKTNQVFFDGERLFISIKKKEQKEKK
jgi:hypothetical protein